METAKIYHYFPAKIRKELSYLQKTGKTTIAKQYLRDYQTIHDHLSSWNQHTEGSFQETLDVLLNGIVSNKLLTHNVLSIKKLRVAPYDDILIKEMADEYTSILDSTGIMKYSFGSAHISPNGNTPEIFIFCSILDNMESLSSEEQTHILELLRDRYANIVAILHNFQQALNQFIIKWAEAGSKPTGRAHDIINGCTGIIKATVLSIQAMKNAAQTYFVV